MHAAGQSSQSDAWPHADPVLHLSSQRLDFIRGQRRHATSTRDACFFRKAHKENLRSKFYSLNMTAPILSQPSLLLHPACTSLPDKGFCTNSPPESGGAG